LCFVIVFVLLFYACVNLGFDESRSRPRQAPLGEMEALNSNETFNVWCIFTKVRDDQTAMKYKFRLMLSSLLRSTSSLVTLNILTDTLSKTVAQLVVLDCVNATGKDIKVVYHDMHLATSIASEVTSVMKPHFSSQPGAYYSDTLFFISIALHKVAPLSQSKAVLLDVDTKIIEDITLLFKEFDKFEESHLVGAAPELTPVYHHILYQYRAKNKKTKLGLPQLSGGFPGVNSGVLLLHLDRIRNSTLYSHLIHPGVLKNLTSKYRFKGHLGDQDFYTLMGLEHPELIYPLDCGWNRQLCTWWKEHGYRDSFDLFAKCTSPVRIFHGNCNTPIPAR